jgi:hypothetical protein
MVQTEDPPSAQADDTGGRVVADLGQLVDTIAAMDDVIIPRRELSTPPAAFTDAVGECRDAGITWDAICEVAEEAISQRTGNLVRTLNYFPTWLATAAAEMAVAEGAKAAERHYRQKIVDEQLARTAEHARVSAESVEPPEDNEVLRRLMARLFSTDEMKEPDILPAERVEGEAVSTHQGVPDGDGLSADEIEELRVIGVELPAAATVEGGRPRTNMSEYA